MTHNAALRVLIASQIGSRMEYLIPTDNLIVLLLHFNLREKSNPIGKL